MKGEYLWAHPNGREGRAHLVWVEAGEDVSGQFKAMPLCTKRGRWYRTTHLAAFLKCRKCLRQQGESIEWQARLMDEKQDAALELKHLDALWKMRDYASRLKAVRRLLPLLSLDDVHRQRLLNLTDTRAK